MAKRVLQADGSYCYTENCKIHDRSGSEGSKLNATQAAAVSSLMMTQALSAPTLEDRFALMADWQAFDDEYRDLIARGETTEDKINNFINGIPDAEETKTYEKAYMLRAMTADDSDVDPEEIHRFVIENTWTKVSNSHIALSMRSKRMDIETKRELAAGVPNGFLSFYDENPVEIEGNEADVLRALNTFEGDDREATLRQDLWCKLAARGHSFEERQAALEHFTDPNGNLADASEGLQALAVNTTLTSEEADELAWFTAHQNSNQWQLVSRALDRGAKLRQDTDNQLHADLAFATRHDVTFEPLPGKTTSWRYENDATVNRAQDEARVAELTQIAKENSKTFVGYGSPTSGDYVSVGRYLTTRGQSDEYWHLVGRLTANDMKQTEKAVKDALRTRKRRGTDENSRALWALQERRDAGKEYIQAQEEYQRFANVLINFTSA
jgi:hypothetical protein